jgi:N-methylhydantoinase A
MTKVCGIDTGGTFTDLVYADDDGALHVVKTFSTHPDYHIGVLRAVDELIASSDGSVEFDLIAHGTTVGTNAVVQNATPAVALLTTPGCRDVLTQMRGSGRVAGLSDEEVIDVQNTNKPTPLVAPQNIFEIDERIDCFGDVVVDLDLAAVEAAANALTAAGIRAVAVCFLWSFLNPEHEEATRELLRRIAPEVHVSISSQVAPRWGEYERFVATVLNAALQPVMASYVSAIETGLTGDHKHLSLMQNNGGIMSVNEAVERPLLTLHSGPVGGIMACRSLGRDLGFENIIATDMGGTSFDVGIVHLGTPQATTTSVVRQHEYFVPAVHVESIGAGGGSIATVDEITGALRVGPRSAGSSPGPACYGRGGTAATVTDADVLMGRLGPQTFWSGNLALDIDAAERAIGALADKLGLATIEVAAGIVEIVDNRMADLTRGSTVRRGLDPRDFVLFAYGGAGPCHVGAYARELGCETVIVPRGNAASVWSAYGIAHADMVKVHEVNKIQRFPLAAAKFSQSFSELEQAATKHMSEQGVDLENIILERELDIRYHNQIFELAVAVPGGELDDVALDRVEKDFYHLYQEVYGEGAGFEGMGIEAVTMRVRSRGGRDHPDAVAKPPSRETSVSQTSPEATSMREVYWSRGLGFISTAVHSDPQLLVPGALIVGPAVVEMPDTTICVHPEQRLEVDATGNFRLAVTAAE